MMEKVVEGKKMITVTEEGLQQSEEEWREV
jgi:hypothetical protein